MKSSKDDDGVFRIRDYISEEFLSLMQNSCTFITKTCTIVYDVDGITANRLVSSPYCSFLRMASEKKDLCDSCCWEISQEAIRRGEGYEAECAGGCVVFSCPIFYNETVIGANTAAVSNPPKSRFKVYDIAENFKVDPAILLEISKKSATNNKRVLENIREQLVTSTHMISQFFKFAYQQKQYTKELVAKNIELEIENQSLTQRLKQLSKTGKR